MTELIYECVGAIMNTAGLAFGSVAFCDYNSTDSLGNGIAPGCSHVFDIGRHQIGEPIFNGCRCLSTLVDRACVYAAATMPDEERVGLEGRFAFAYSERHLPLPQPYHHAAGLFQTIVLLS